MKIAILGQDQMSRNRRSWAGPQNQKMPSGHPGEEGDAVVHGDVGDDERGAGVVDDERGALGEDGALRE